MATDFISNAPFYIIVIGITIIILLKIKSDADRRWENPGYRNNYRPHVKYKAPRYVDDDIYEDEYERELARLEAREERKAQKWDEIQDERKRKRDEEYNSRPLKNVFGFRR